jgi:hypothetical protein
MINKTLTIMKKKIFLSVVFISLVLIGLAQVPEAFNYQAVVRNNAGEVVADQNVSFKISILQDSPSGTVVYAESHSITTNGFGLATLKIGDGTVLDGVFSPAGWGLNSHFLKIEFDPAGGVAFTHLGTSQLLAVPYAFHAKTVEDDAVDDADADPGNELQTLSIAGNDLSIAEGNTVTLPSIWETDGTNAYIIDGKVGIGGNPGASNIQFDVKTEDNIAIKAINNSTLYGAIFAENTGSGVAADFRDRIKILDGTQGAGRVLTSDANGVSSWQSPVWNRNGEYTYYNDGYVGIGTSNPVRNLDIHGQGTSCYLGFHTNASGSSSTDGFLVGMTSPSNVGYVWMWDNHPLELGTNNITRIHISGDGNVGIGTDAPTFTLSVNGTAGKTGGGSWSVFSDRRLKDLHGSYDKGLSEILALQPVIFNYKVDNPLDLPSDQEEIGLVAQEVQEIFPEAVSVSQSGYLDFNMHPINVAFVNAIKELKTENDNLKTDNNYLKNKVNKLESRLAEIERMLQQ